MDKLHRYMPQLMIVLGIIIALVSYFADVIGVGMSARLGFRQLMGALLGLIIAINGVTVWAIRKRD